MTRPLSYFCADTVCGHQAVLHSENGKCTFRGCQCPGLLAGLSLREWEVLRGLAKGFGIKGVAEQLNLSVPTVEAHRYHIFHKTGAQTTLELILGALRSGLVTMEDLPTLKARVEINPKFRVGQS